MKWCLVFTLIFLFTSEVMGKEIVGMKYGIDEKQEMDLHLPEGKKDFPIILFAHGGCWKAGDKSDYDWLGRYFVKNGIGFVNINYRLVPSVNYRDQLEDVMNSFIWVRNSFPDKRVYLMGHSAGGHLVSLLACDHKYLTNNRLSSIDIAGVVSISGVYEINWTIKVYGLNKGFEGFDKREASPIHLASSQAPRFLLLCGDKDTISLEKQAKYFHNRLVMKGCDSRLIIGKDKDHNAIIDSLIDSSYSSEILKFIK